MHTNTRETYIWLVDRIYDTVEEEIAKCWPAAPAFVVPWRLQVNIYIETVKTLELRKADDERSYA